MNTYSVDAQEYGDMLDQDLDLDGEITVDRRGYSPEVAAELGDDYLGNRMLLFDTEQEQSDSIEPGYFPGDLLEEIYDNRDFIQDATGTGPLSISLRANYLPAEEDRFRLIAELDDQGGAAPYHRAKQLSDRIGSLSEEDVRDDRFMQEAVTFYQENEEDIELEDVDVPAVMGTHSTDSMTFSFLGEEFTFLDSEPERELEQNEIVLNHQANRSSRPERQYMHRYRKTEDGYTSTGYSILIPDLTGKEPIGERRGRKVHVKTGSNQGNEHTILVLDKEMETDYREEIGAEIYGGRAVDAERVLSLHHNYGTPRIYYPADGPGKDLLEDLLDSVIDESKDLRSRERRWQHAGPVLRSEDGRSNLERLMDQ